MHQFLTPLRHWVLHTWVLWIKHHWKHRSVLRWPNYPSRPYSSKDNSLTCCPTLHWSASLWGGICVWPANIACMGGCVECALFKYMERSTFVYEAGTTIWSFRKKRRLPQNRKASAFQMCTSWAPEQIWPMTSWKHMALLKIASQSAQLGTPEFTEEHKGYFLCYLLHFFKLKPRCIFSKGRTKL